MYAIIKTGGKQYRVQEGDVIDVELLNGEEGSEIKLEDILLINNENKTLLGKKLSGSVIIAEYVGIALGPKIRSMKYKRRCNQYKRFGHRQKYSRIKIKEIRHKA